jgi:hypothetical protein
MNDRTIEVRFQAKKQIFSTVFRHVLGPKFYPTQWMFLGFSPEVTRLEREAGGSRPLGGANFKNVWNNTSTILIGLHGMGRYSKIILLSLPYTAELHLVRSVKGDTEPVDGHIHPPCTGNANCHLHTGLPVHQETR